MFRGRTTLCMFQKLLVLFSFGVLGSDLAGADGPDLTSVDINSIDRSQTYNLGPTGLRGWIYTHPDSPTATIYGRLTTTPPWQILVTAVGANTPAKGILEINDVILGASAGAGNVP